MKNLDLKKLVDEKKIGEIAKLIISGKIKETKEILILQDDEGKSVAHYLAYYHTTWTTDDPEILKLKDKQETSVAHILAKKSNIVKWDTNNKEILMIEDSKGRSVAHELAYHSNTTNWSTNDKDILIIQGDEGKSVAHILAYYHPTWDTDDPEILKLKDYYDYTVADVLVDKGKLL